MTYTIQQMIVNYLTVGAVLGVIAAFSHDWQTERSPLPVRAAFLVFYVALFVSIWPVIAFGAAYEGWRRENNQWKD